MSDLILHCYLRPATALANKHTVAGNIEFVLDADRLEQLHRDGLVADAQRYLDPDIPYQIEVEGPSYDDAVEALRKLRAERVAQLEKEAAADRITKAYLALPPEALYPVQLDEIWKAYRDLGVTPPPRDVLERLDNARTVAHYLADLERRLADPTAKRTFFMREGWKPDPRVMSPSMIEKAAAAEAILAKREAVAEQERIAAAEREAAKVREAECRLLQAHGTPNQMERWEAELLDDAELCAIARDVAFVAFQSFARQRRIEDGEVPHPQGMACDTYDAELARESRPPTALTADQWEIHKAIFAAADESVHTWGALGEIFAKPEVTLLEHVVRCSRCGKEASRPAARIAVAWAGRTLVRQYALVRRAGA